MLLQTLDKSEQFAKWSPKGANLAPGLRQWWWFGPLGSPGWPCARLGSTRRRVAKKEKQATRKDVKWKSGKKEELERVSGKNGKEEG